MTDGETILWRRIDLPGHEFATIARRGDGWRLHGVAILAESGRPCRVEYDIDCDARWTTRRCAIRGHVGAQPVHLVLERSPSAVWSVGGIETPALQGCDDHYV